MSQDHPAFDLVEPLMKTLLLPGAVVAIATRQGTEIRAFGTRTLHGDDPVEPDDHFRIGSNTKTMTGTALLQLVDAKQVSLTDSVAHHLKRYAGDPRLDAITVEQILDMRSGLYNYTEQLEINRLMDADPAYVFDPQQVIGWGLEHAEYFPPGADFHYSNTNTCLAGLIVEMYSAQPLGVVLQDKVFAKIGISQTSLPANEDATIPAAHPRGYMYGTNVATIKTLALPAEDQKRAYDGTLLPSDYTDLNPSWAWAAGAVVSTAGDLVTYVQHLVEGGLLSDDLQRQRMASLRPAGDDPGAAEYGWALAKFGPMYGHDGSLPGFQSFMGHDPVKGNTLVVLTNLTAAPDGRETANELAKAIIPVL